MQRAWIARTANVGAPGPDGGETVSDEELSGIGAVVIERKAKANTREAYFAVTIAVYGRFVNTLYYHDRADSAEHADSVKLMMEGVLGKPE